MDVEQHLKTMIGDLVVTVARQAAEIDALRQQLQAPPAAPPAEPKP